MPLIVRDPRKASDAGRGKQLDLFSENIDIMPTMLHWLGIDPPSQCDGRSLLPVLASGEAPAYWRTAVYWDYDFRHHADWLMDEQPHLSPHQCHLSVIRDERFKYVHFPALPPLLYDLTTDPGELQDVGSLPEYASVRLEYAEKLLSHRMRYTARGLSETLLTPDGPVISPCAP